MKDLQIFNSEENELLKNNSERIIEALTNNQKMIIESISSISDSTKETYLKRTGKFCKFIQQNGIHSFSFEDYISYISSQYTSASTINGYFDAAKKLLTQSHHRFGILPTDITVNVKRKKRRTGHVKNGVAYNEVKRVSDYISNIKRDSTRLRINAMFHLLYAQGLRQFEVCNIRIEEINLNDRTLLILGKARDEKEAINLFSVTVQALKEYIEFLGVNEGYLFANKEGNAISTAYVRKLWTDPKYGIFQKAGVESKGVHGFRHYFITMIGERTNGNYQKMQQLGRIQTIETVKKYNDKRVLKADIDALESAFVV